MNATMDRAEAPTLAFDRRIPNATGGCSTGHTTRLAGSRVPSATVVLFVLASFASLVACGEADGPAPMSTNDGSPNVDAGPPPEGGVPLGPDGSIVVPPAAIETIAPMRVQAGTAFPVTCLLLDATGAEVVAEMVVTRARLAPADASTEEPIGTFTVTRAGEVLVTCDAASLGLVDQTPAVVIIDPGPATTVVTELDRTSVVAGESVHASCSAFDAWGNPVPDAVFGFAVAPAESGNTVMGTSATLETAGLYEAACTLPGSQVRGVPLEVVPALPASIVLTKLPDQPTYGLGQIVDVVHIVSDRFGNVVPDAVVDFVSAPAGSPVGAARFRYFSEGVYVVTATVAPPTDGGVPVQATTQIVVSGVGPNIECELDGTMVDAPPGRAVAFRGNVSDASGIASVRVNGSEVPVARDGSFEANVVAVFGMNFVDVVSTDTLGEENSRTCTFLASGAWTPESSHLDDSLSLRLAQAAIDDDNTADGLDSLNDILYAVLNSAGVRNQLRTALIGASPLYNNCVIPGPFGTCILRIRVDVRDATISGPNSTRLRLVSGGMAATATLRNLAVRLDISGTTGWVRIDSVTAGVTLDVGLSGGRPNASVRSVDTVTVGRISTEFSGFVGWVIDEILVPLAQGYLRDLVATQIRNYVRDNFNAVLDGVLESVDISTLGTTFRVPRLDGSGDIPLSFGVRFSSLGTTTSRMLLGIGTRFTAPAAHARATLGAPRQLGTVLADPAVTTPVAVAVHHGMLNQVLHALWRGGLLEGTIDADALGGSAGLSAELSTALPPVAALRDGGRVELGLGGINLALTYPGLFDQPILVNLGAIGSMSVSLVGNDLRFGSLTIEELYFSTDQVSLDAETRDVLERVLRSLVQRIFDASLNDSLPALPIPSFTLPASVATYGLPAGAELGITTPSLSRSSNHLVLSGGFGRR